MSQKTDTRLEHLQQLNSKKEWINYDLYRLMYREDLYIIAYERIKSKPGNMTPGTDAETLDGFSLTTIREIIQEMKTEQFRFRPVRQQFIPKPNGKNVGLTDFHGGGKLEREHPTGGHHAKRPESLHEGIQVGSGPVSSKERKIASPNCTGSGHCR